MAPASQATSIPLSVRVSNNTDIDAPNFSVKVKIFRTNALGEPLDKDPIYCRTQNVSNLVRRGNLDVGMPEWNARKSQRDTNAYYRIYANIVMFQPDLVPKNDTTYTDFNLIFGTQFAYDPAVEEPINSASQFLGGGRGLNFLHPTNSSGYPRAGGPQGWDALLDAGGIPGGNGSGNIAVKFEILNTDTLRGFSIYWASLNQAADQVTFRLYDGSTQTPSSNIILQAVTTRGGPGFQNLYERYVDYFFNNPVVLARGTYWVGISQDGSTGYELGASASRSAMRTTSRFIDLAGNLGEAGISLNIDKNFRRVQSGNLVNNNYFAFQNIANNISWVPFTPTSGNPAFGHLNHNGQPVDAATQTLTRGSWIPMLRPYFGQKSYGEAASEFEWCVDDYPVELLSFNGSIRTSGVDLFWETASEQDNYGFYVEKRIQGDVDFQTIGFVAGNGNSSTLNRYNYSDNDVRAKTTYEYRLRQIDKDGTHSCGYSEIVTLTFDKIGALVLENNAPNPFVNQTTMKFTLPVAQNARLEVVDMFGNVVKTITNGYLGATTHTFTYDGTDSNGNQLNSGQYIFRLTADNEVLSGKMTIIR